MLGHPRSVSSISRAVTINRLVALTMQGPRVMASPSPFRHEERILKALLLLTRGACDSPLEQLELSELDSAPQLDPEPLERAVTIEEWGAHVRGQVPRLWRDARTPLHANEAPAKPRR